MNQPVAPKDPEQKRPYFYIMRDKEVFVAKQENGKGVCFLYQNDGRMISSARIVGNIEDEEILTLMEDVEGFKKLVHSIGVSVESVDASDDIQFVFQMYGKNDTYGGGANLIAGLKGNGSEERIYLSEVDWQEDDFIPGQIRVEMDTPEKLVNISVRFYLNDGFEAPEVVEETAVDTSSDNYQEMIKKSLVDCGNIYRIAKTIEKAKNGEEVTLAYIGGSITQGAGATPINTECYAHKSYQKFKEAFAKGDNVKFVKAGVGGTPSELGMIRFERDILRDGIEPDIVVVEFAVNDEGDETKGTCYESLVRKILNLPNHPAVVLLFAVFADDYNLQMRLMPVGQHYELPMVSVKNAVTPQFYDKENRILSKNQYFYDRYHPSNIGHTIMSDCLMNLYKEIEKQMELGQVPEEDEMLLLIRKAPILGATFENIKLLDKKNAYSMADIDCGGFVNTDEVLQSVEMDVDLKPTPEFPYNWMYDGILINTPWFEMNIKCRALVMVFKDSADLDAAKANVYVDGKFVRTADPRENGWVHCNPIIIIDENDSVNHTVRVQIDDNDIQKKFTILAFGYVE